MGDAPSFTATNWRTVSTVASSATVTRCDLWALTKICMMMECCSKARGGATPRETRGSVAGRQLQGPALQEAADHEGHHVRAAAATRAPRAAGAPGSHQARGATQGTGRCLVARRWALATSPRGLPPVRAASCQAPRLPSLFSSLQPRSGTSAGCWGRGGQPHAGRRPRGHARRAGAPHDCGPPVLERGHGRRLRRGATQLASTLLAEAPMRLKLFLLALES